MIPLLQYRIPFQPNHPIHSTWYVVVTDTLQHFYFLQALRRSYWQLADVQCAFPQDTDLGIDVDALAAAIDFDAVAILMAKARGAVPRDKNARLSLHSKPHTNAHLGSAPHHETQRSQSDLGDPESGHTKDNEEQHPDNDNDQDYNEYNEPLPDNHNDQDPDEHNESLPDDHDDQYPDEHDESLPDDHDDQCPNDRDRDHEDSVPLRSTPPLSQSQVDSNATGTLGAIQGYSSSDSECEDEVACSGEIACPGNSPHSPILSECNDEISDTELEKSHQEFKRLLTNFKSRISTYEPWFLVHEELMADFVQCPEYFAVTDEQVREQLFHDWCSDAQSHKSDLDNKQLPQPYPTSPILFFRFLQQHKEAVKRLFFGEFKLKFRDSLSAFEQLPRARMESCFRQYKIMITDFAAYEKRTKESPHYDLSVNLKRQKLIQFLESHLEDLKHAFEKVSLPPLATSQDDDDFSKWIHLVNHANLAKSVVEHVTNFIVGDEKRYECYALLYNSYCQPENGTA